MYYESDFQKTLKTILFFLFFCIKYLCRKCFNCITGSKIRQNFSRRRRGILHEGVSKIVFDFESHEKLMEEREINDEILKILPPKNFQFQLDFNYFLNTENSNKLIKKKKIMQISRLHSNTSVFERVSNNSNEFASNSPVDRYSKFFTIDSSPRHGFAGAPNRMILERSEFENLKLENKTLQDQIKKAKKEIYNLKYLFIVHQDYNTIEGKEQMEKDLKEDEFFLQEILINYENFLQVFEDVKYSEENKLALIQNNGVLYDDEKIQIAFHNSFMKLNTNNPLISVKIRVSNITFLIISNIQITFNSRSILI